MRLSIDPDDVGFDPDKCGRYRVTVDGATLNWITADDVLGEAKVVALKPDGNLDINPQTGAPWIIWKRGRVVFHRANQ